MGFWDTIGLATPEDEQRENKEAWAKLATVLSEAGRNLPKASIQETDGECLTCGEWGKLGNNLCLDCWDYVVDQTSPNHPEWPDANQLRKIVEAELTEARGW